MKKILAILIVSIFFSSAYGSEPISVHWDCFLPSEDVSCVELNTSLITPASGLEETSISSDAAIAINLRSIPLVNQMEYQISLTGKLFSLSLKHHLNSTLSIPERTENLLALINKSIDFYRPILGGTPQTEDPLANKPFYIAPSVSGMGSRNQGMEMLNAGASMTANYSTSRWRLVGELGGGFVNSKSEKTAYSPEISSKIFITAEELELSEVLMQKDGMWPSLPKT